MVGHALGVSRGYLWPLSLLYAGASWAVASSLALGAFPCLVSRFGIGWRLADHLGKDLIDARNQLLDRLETVTPGALVAGAVADPLTKPLGTSEPRH